MSEQTAMIVDCVRDTISAHRMLSPGIRVLVAISGGPDSVALLHILRVLGYDVVAAHLDHMTRDGESSIDADFVEALASSMEIPFVSERRPVESEAAASPESFEQTARTARYSFFANAAKAHNCAAIATGHNSNDVAETVLWRMVRGTSVDGIASIPPVRLLGTAKVVRPLIDCTRAEIEDYLSSHSIAFRTDASNEDRRFVRNRIRHELIPMLERDYNPKVRDALVRLATLARDDAALLAEIVDPFLESCMTEDGGLDRKCFADASEAMQRRVFQAFAQHAGVDPSFERTEVAREFIVTGRTGARLDLGGSRLINTRTTTRFERECIAEELEVMPVPGEVIALGKHFVARILGGSPAESLATYCSASRQVFDGDILGDTVCIRARRPGDRFTPLGMKGSRKLQDYFVDNGTSRDDRDHIPIVVANGAIAWIVGGAMDGRFAVSKSTRTFVTLEVTNATE